MSSRFAGSAGAAAAGALPLFYWVSSGSAAITAAASLLSWLLVGAAVEDAVSLRISHFWWVGGIAGGIATAWVAGGTVAVADRIRDILVVAGGFGLCAIAACRFRPAAVGAADYGVLAAVTAACGAAATLEIVLLAGLIALAWLVLPRGTLGALMGGAAVAGAVALGLAGTVGAVIFLATVAIRHPAAYARAAPFGACLTVGALCVVVFGTAAPVPVSAVVRHDLVLQHLTTTKP
jgi:hypothetical protein